ncbi:MAG: thiamine-phosphate kinase [Prochlorococcus sp.]|jgi:thiamine-monophosphate kinase|nr:thiamine-phosphate kinase [Prochlorococcaceae cyanobacterium ETNP18_MAG_14]
MGETLYQIGESELLNRLARFAPAGQLDDDTAQIQTGGRDLLVNTDVLVEGVHFCEATTTPRDIGWRCVAANFSDLAASGVDQILGITVALIAPSDTPWKWVEEVYTGIEEALKQFGGALLGGDCSRGEQRLLAITALGTVGPARLHRCHARPGDSLVVSGPHGLSRLGLALLLCEPLIQAARLPEQLKQAAINAHQHPQPSLKALRSLEACKPKKLPWRAGGTDSSDGLLEAVKSLCKSSGCRAIIDPDNLPRAPEWPLGSPWDNWCLNGGEDFELVLSLPPKWASAWLEAHPSSQAIGVMETGPPQVLWADSRAVINTSPSFKHFHQ